METFITTLATLCKMNLDAALDLVRRIHLALTAGGVGEVMRGPDGERGSDKLVRRMQYFAVEPGEEREDLFEDVLGMLLDAAIEAQNAGPVTATSREPRGSRFTWERATKAFGFIIRCILHDFDDTEREEARGHFRKALARIDGCPPLGDEALGYEVKQIQRWFEDEGKVELACKVSSALCEELNLAEMTDPQKRATKRLARAATERTQRAGKAADGRAKNAERLAALAALADPNRGSSRLATDATGALEDPGSEPVKELKETQKAFKLRYGAWVQAKAAYDAQQA